MVALKYILMITALISTYILLVVILSLIFEKKSRIRYRLQHIKEMYKNGVEEDDIRNLPLYDRIIRPLFNKIKSMIIKMTPDGFINRLESNLKAADYPFGLRVGGWIGVMIIFYLVIPVIFIFVIGRNSMPLLSKILLSLITAIISVLIPNTLLKGRISRRKRKMAFELPDILDLLTVSVEAGLGFDAALGKITETAKGELVKELQITTREIQLGKSRREALLHMSKRCDIPDISNFVTSFVQADQLGVSIGRILRVQADQMRDKRKQRAREQAMKAPVKILIPMVFFIFPTIFVVILGPAMIQISKVLFKR